MHCRFEFICFFANTYREAVMMLEFSIQKFKEAEFSLEPTIHSQSSLFAFLPFLAICLNNNKFYTFIKKQIV